MLDGNVFAREEEFKLQSVWQQMAQSKARIVFTGGGKHPHAKPLIFEKAQKRSSMRANVELIAVTREIWLAEIETIRRMEQGFIKVKAYG